MQITAKEWEVLSFCIPVFFCLCFEVQYFCFVKSKIALYLLENAELVILEKVENQYSY